MSDQLNIIDCELWTRIGVSKEEREAEQRLLVTVGMTVDTRAAAKSDDVKKSINYFDLATDLKLLAHKERKTIERFAEDIAQMILKKHKPIDVTVTVKKFAIPAAKAIEIQITRTKSVGGRAPGG